MTDKVQKIKEWISKEQDGLMNAQGNFEYPEHEGVYHILCNLDAYIELLQEEPVSEGLEEAAYNAYPYNGDYRGQGDSNSKFREVYINGYHQAEKDLELTWEDMRELYIIFAEVDTEIELCKTDIQAETIGYYQEVLKRFKTKKGEEV